MKNDMVSIPSASMNGGLKAASNSGTVSVGVPGTVMTNAQRVYLTPASSYHIPTRQSSISGASATGVGMVATAKVNNSSIGVGSSNPNAVPSPSASGSMRYFSQFSQLQTMQHLNARVGQRKLLNGGDTMVLVNGSKPLFFATPTNKFLTTTNTTTVPNCNKVLFLNQQKQEQGVVAEHEQEERHGSHDEDIIEMNHEDAQRRQLGNPLAQLTGGTRPTDLDAEPELDIVINNVVCSFSVRCHLKLREIALNGSNVEYRRENGMVTMKLRRPYTTASIWSSGRITCTGATSESQAKIAARRYARCLSKLGFPTHFQNFRIVNVLGTCSMPWSIKIVNFSERHRENASYEPELHPGVTYKMREPKATLKIFSTGSITVTAASVNDVESAIQNIYPLVHEFRKQRSAEELLHLGQKHRAQAVEEPNELDDQLALEANNTVKVNMSCAPINTVHCLDRYNKYNQMLEKPQTEYNFARDAFGQKAKGSNSGPDNICANARRRATEYWASKLQNKRPRYNDPGLMATANTGGMIRTTSHAVSNASANAILGAVVKKLHSGPLIPMDVVLKQAGSRARKATASTEYQVDDLIVEDDDEEMSEQF